MEPELPHVILATEARRDATRQAMAAAKPADQFSQARNQYIGTLTHTGPRSARGTVTNRKLMNDLKASYFTALPRRPNSSRAREGLSPRVVLTGADVSAERSPHPPLLNGESTERVRHNPAPVYALSKSREVDLALLEVMETLRSSKVTHPMSPHPQRVEIAFTALDHVINGAQGTLKEVLAAVRSELHAAAYSCGPPMPRAWGSQEPALYFETHRQNERQLVSAQRRIDELVHQLKVKSAAGPSLPQSEVVPGDEALATEAVELRSQVRLLRNKLRRAQRETSFLSNQTDDLRRTLNQSYERMYEWVHKESRKKGAKEKLEALVRQSNEQIARLLSQPYTGVSLEKPDTVDPFSAHSEWKPFE